MRIKINTICGNHNNLSALARGSQVWLNLRHQCLPLCGLPLCGSIDSAGF